MAGMTGEEDWHLSTITVMAFINLSDTFGDYIDRAGLVPVVNSEEDALVLSDAHIDDHSGRHEEGGADEPTGITGKLNDHSARHEEGGADEPTGITGKLNSHAGRHEYGGADEVSHNNLALTEGDHHIPEFTRLNDTPADYVGNAGKVHEVNSTEDGLTPSAASIDAHGARHEDGGADEILHNNLALNPDDHHAPVIPSGTKMLFKQSAAPSLWTFVAEDNDRALLHTSTEADGGTIGGDWQQDGHTLAISEIPGHDHGGGGSTGDDGAHNHGVRCHDISAVMESPAGNYPGDSGDVQWYDEENSTMNASMITDVGNHNHSYNVASEGGGGAHDHGSAWRPAYVKVITCDKD